MRCLYAAALAAAALWRAPAVPPTAVAVPSRYGFLTDKVAPEFRRDEIEPLCCSRGIRKEILGPPMLPEWSGLGGMDVWQSFSDTLDVNTSQSHTEIAPDMRQIAQNDHLVAQIPVPPDNNLCQVAWARATSDLILSDYTRARPAALLSTLKHATLTRSRSSGVAAGPPEVPPAQPAGSWASGPPGGASGVLTSSTSTSHDRPRVDDARPSDEAASGGAPASSVGGVPGLDMSALQSMLDASVSKAVEHATAPLFQELGLLKDQVRHRSTNLGARGRALHRRFGDGSSSGATRSDVESIVNDTESYLRVDPHSNNHFGAQDLEHAGKFI